MGDKALEDLKQEIRDEMKYAMELYNYTDKRTLVEDVAYELEHNEWVEDTTHVVWEIAEEFVKD